MAAVSDPLTCANILTLHASVVCGFTQLKLATRGHVPTHIDIRHEPGRSGTIGRASKAKDEKKKKSGMVFGWKETETMLSPFRFEGATENKNDIRNTAVR